MQSVVHIKSNSFLKKQFMALSAKLTWSITLHLVMIVLYHIVSY